MKSTNIRLNRRSATAAILTGFFSSAAAAQESSGSEKDNSRIILEIFSAIERRDVKRVMELFDPEVEMHWPPSLPYGGTSRGSQEKHPTWGETWNPLQPTALERKMDARVVGGKGNEVAVLWRQRGLSPSGERFEGEVIGLYEIRNFKLTRAQMFYFDTLELKQFLDRARSEIPAKN